jgi:hypothetical protein
MDFMLLLSNRFAQIWVGSGNFGACIWIDGVGVQVSDVICADFMRATWFVYTTLLENGVFAAVSKNHANTSSTEIVRGYPVYDGPSVLRNVQFINFGTSEKNPMAPIDIFGGALASTKNAVESLKFVNPDTLSILDRNDDEVMAQIVDIDGSVTGKKGGQIIVPLKDEKGAKIMDPLRDSGTCVLKGNAYMCGPESSAAWVLLDKFRQTPTGSEAKTPLTPLTVSMSSNAPNNSSTNKVNGGSRTVRPRKTFPHQYALSLLPNTPYTFTSTAPWSCFTIMFYWGFIGERYNVRLVGIPASKKVQGATRVASLAALQSATATSDFHDGKDLHIVAFISQIAELPGFSIGKVGHSTILDICDGPSAMTDMHLPNVPLSSAVSRMGTVNNPQATGASATLPRSAATAGTVPTAPVASHNRHPVPSVANVTPNRR